MQVSLRVEYPRYWLAWQGCSRFFVTAVVADLRLLTVESRYFAQACVVCDYAHADRGCLDPEIDYRTRPTMRHPAIVGQSPRCHRLNLNQN